MDYHCCSESVPPSLPPPLSPLPPRPPAPPQAPPQAPQRGLLGDVRRAACIHHSVLSAWVASEMQGYLNSPDWLWTVDWSLDAYRSWFASGLPTVLAELAEWQVWGGGFVVGQVWGNLPPGGVGITRIAITSVKCDSFTLRSVEAEFCFPFRVGGRALGIDFSCRGEWLIELSQPMAPVHGLLDNATSTLSGTYELRLEPESWLELSELDLQKRDVFTPTSSCSFHMVPKIAMHLGTVT